MLVTTSLGDLSFIGLQPKAPFTETLEWFTDVIPSYNGGEERLKLRQEPRQAFEAKYLASHLQSKDVLNTVYGSLVGQWAIPVWGEAQYVGSLALGATGAPVGNATADLRTGGLALLYGVDGGLQLVTVASVSSGAITFPALASAVRAGYLVPIRVGRIGTPVRRQTTGFETRWTLNYLVDDNIEITSAAPAQYLGNDIYFEPGLITSDLLDDDIKTQVDTNDYALGVVKVSTPWTYPRTMRDYSAIATTPAEAWALRQWLHRRSGRYRAFWQPTFENDFRIVDGGSITTALLVEPDSWDTLSQQRTHIAIEDATGWHARAILASSVTDGVLELDLSATLGGIDPSTVRRVSYLSLRRLDTDSVELSWAGGTCETTFRVTELSP